MGLLHWYLEAYNTVRNKSKPTEKKTNSKMEEAVIQHRTQVAVVRM
jgi:hypothetical protein